MVSTALESVKAKLVTVTDPYEADKLRTQQRRLEGELRNVRGQLLHSSQVQHSPTSTFLLHYYSAYTPIIFTKIAELSIRKKGNCADNRLPLVPQRLEEAEVENARLEHELMILRQKVLRALKHATTLQTHNFGPKDMEGELQVCAVLAVRSFQAKLFVFFPEGSNSDS